MLYTQSIHVNAAREMKGLSVQAHHTNSKNADRELLIVIFAMGKK